MKDIEVNKIHTFKHSQLCQYENTRGARSNIIWMPIEYCWSYEWLFKNVKSFRKWVYMSHNCKKKRTRNKYMNKITREMTWLEKQIQKYI